MSNILGIYNKTQETLCLIILYTMKVSKCMYLTPIKVELILGEIKLLKKLITSRFYWKDMVSDIREFVRVCDDYQRNNDVKFSKTNAALHLCNTCGIVGLVSSNVELDIGLFYVATYSCMHIIN